MARIIIRRIEIKKNNYKLTQSVIITCKEFSVYLAMYKVFPFKLNLYEYIINVKNCSRFGHYAERCYHEKHQSCCSQLKYKHCEDLSMIH